MHYVYVLLSEKDKGLYTGYTSDLEKRLSEHNLGLSKSTCNRRPLKLIYFEACIDRRDAIHRERYLKTTYGKRYIRNRLKYYFEEEVLS
jgi:putative endonuclease